MPSQSEFEDKLDQLADYAESINDEVVESDVENIISQEYREEEYELTGHHCLHGDSTYVVAGHPDQPYFVIMYFLSVVQNLARSLPQEVVDGIIIDSESPAEGEMDRSMQAAYKLLEEIPPAEKQMYNLQTFLVISSSIVATSLITQEEHNLESVELGKKIFPYENRFRLSDYNDAVQAVVGAGTRTGTWISRTMNIDFDEDDPEDTTLSLNY